MQMQEDSRQVIDAAVRAIPPAAVTFSNTVLSMPVEKWLTVVMIIYTVLQVVLLVRDRFMRRRRIEAEDAGK